MNYKFNDVTVSRPLLVETVLAYRFLKYGEHTRVDHGDDGMIGNCNCFGLFLLTARDLGLLDEDFDVNLPYGVHRKGRAAILWEVVRQNFERIEKRDMDAGDLLLARWKDVDRGLQTPHHVMLHLGQKEIERHGFFIHALDVPGTGKGRVVVSRLTGLDYLRVDSAWRLKGIQ